jgi:small multidrug resistance family-3 protein
MKSILDSIVATPVGAFAVLTFAALLEALGDSFFQSGLYRSSGATRALYLILGTAVLALYGLTVNTPPWDFGKLLGLYVVLFFVMAQILTKVRFHQSPTMPIYVGGMLIVLGGLVIAFWKP